MTTWSPGSVVGGTLSGGNLILTYASGANAGAVSSTSKTSGKWYFELTFGTATVFYAVDLTNALIWIQTPGNFWNSEAPGNDPGTGIGGISISSLTPSGGLTIFATVNAGADDFSLGGVANSSVNLSTVPDNADNVACWDWFNNGTLFVNGVSEAAIGDFSGPNSTVTLNTGGSAFVGTVPSGFTSWDVPTVGGTWASTEAKDKFSGSGHPAAAGTWASTEAKDQFAAFDFPPATGAWASTEHADTFHGTAFSGPITGTWISSEHADRFAGAGFVNLESGETPPVTGGARVVFLVT